MEWLGELWRRLRFLFDRRGFEAGIEDELQFHLEMKQAEQHARGLPIKEARSTARR